MIVNSNMLWKCWNRERQDAGRGRVSLHGSIICMVRRYAGLLLYKHATKSRVSNIPAMLVS